MSSRRSLRAICTIPLVLALASTTLASPGTAQGPRRPTDARLALAIDSAARALIASKGAPSVSIAVSRNGRTIYAKAFGTADLEQGIQATPKSVYLIGSITKQFTAAGIMSLVEEGKVSLDDTLGRFIPGWPAATRGVTIRQLLNHTAGIKDYTSIPRWQPLMALPLSRDSMLALFRDAPPDFTPGTRWSYSNSGYYLLGLVIEQASGMSYADFVARRLAGRAQLPTFGYCDSRRVMRGRVPGYSVGEKGFSNAAPLYVDQAYAAGALCTTAEGLVAWTRALSSGRVVTAASYAQMTNPLPLPDGKPQTYGFGLALNPLDGHRGISHNGGINGFRSQMAYYPDDSLIVAVLINGESGAADRLERVISRKALGLVEEAAKDLPVTPEEQTRVAGKYHQGEMVVEVKPAGDRLALEGAGEPARLLHQGGGQYRVSSNPEMRVQFSGNGAKADALVLQVSGATISLTRVP